MENYLPSDVFNNLSIESTFLKVNNTFSTILSGNKKSRVSCIIYHLYNNRFEAYPMAFYFHLMAK
jgi:hypothetical protein